MFKKLLPLTFILFVIFFTGSTSKAATYGNFTYTVSSGKATITECNTSASGAVTVPSSINGYPVMAIGNCAFLSCTSIQSISLPNSVTVIDDMAFAYCTSLQSVSMPENLTTIGDGAFYECTSLFSIIIPDKVTSIGENAFLRCTSLSAVTIGKSVKSIGSNAFMYCEKIVSVNIIDLKNYCQIDFAFGTSSPFYYKQATLFVNGEYCRDLVIPDGTEYISAAAFIFCRSIYSLVIPGSVKSIGNSAFYWNNRLDEITIGYGVTSIGDYAFYKCRPSTITFTDSVTSIGNYAFYDDTNILFHTYNIYFHGSQSTWDSIQVGHDNNYLTEADALYIIPPTVCITYYYNNETGASMAQSVDAGTTATAAKTVPQRLGYTLLGWATSASATTAKYRPGDSITVGRENISLYAVWKKTTYTTASVSKGSAYNTITVTPYNIPDGSSITLACYNDGTLIYIGTKTVGSDDLIYSAPNTYDTFKVLAFDSLGSMTPLTEPLIK